MLLIPGMAAAAAGGRGIVRAVGAVLMGAWLETASISSMRRQVCCGRVNVGRHDSRVSANTPNKIRKPKSVCHWLFISYAMQADIVDGEQEQLAALVRMRCARSHPGDIWDEVGNWIYLFMRRKEGQVSSDLKLLETGLRGSRARDFFPPSLNSTL